MTDHSKLFEGIKEFTKSRLIGTESPDKSYTFGEMLGGSAFARMCFNILKEQKVNPDIMLMCARLNLAFENEETAFLVPINRQRKIKDIRRFAIGYKAKISTFENEIAFLCKTYKTNRFAVIFNYNYKGSPIDELADLDKFFRRMIKKGFKIVDFIKVIDGKATSLLYPYYNGYQK